MSHQPLKPLRTIRANVSPLALAKQYLYHEFLKLFWDIADAPFRKKIRRSIYRMDKRDGPQNLWQLVAAIAEGWKIKWVFRLLTNPAYRWDLEIRGIDDLTMTGFSPIQVDWVTFRCHRRFREFAEYYRANRPFFKKYMPNLLPRPERDHHPVFVYWNSKEKQLHIFDGMRRVVLAAIQGKKYIRVYTGYPVGSGKPLVNNDKIRYIKHLFDDARKDTVTFQAFVRIGREIVRQSRNGAKLFQKGIKPWSDERAKKFVQAILKK